MSLHQGRYIFSLVIFFIPTILSAQNIFSKKELEYKKTFLPYDSPYTFALEDKQFVMLSEVKKNTMKLERYDQYFFEQWETEIEFHEDESVPQMFIRGDSAIAYSFTTIEDKSQFRLTFRYFDLQTGKELDPTNYVFSMVVKEGYDPIVTFNENKSKFVIYHYLINDEGKDQAVFQIFEIGHETPLKQYYLNAEELSPSKACRVHLSEEGDLFLIAIHPGEFKANTSFWGFRNKKFTQISNNFFFERPIDGIHNIDIIRQSSSSYFVSFSANIEDEFIGYNFTSYNVVLNSVMYSHNQNLRKDEIDLLYKDYYVTGPNQKKKHLEIPESLTDFRLVKSFVNGQNDIILLIEHLEIPDEFHENGVHLNKPWKHKSKDDKFYFGGDILMFCYTASGEQKWKKVIQKTQYSQGNGLALSFIGEILNDNLRLLMYESSKGGNFYIMDINTIDGSLAKKTNLLPEKKFEFTKKYACLLDEHSVLLCGVAPMNITKRTLMLVEF